MTIASAQTIRALGIFTPFSERTKHKGLTYGLGPAGYDIRIAETLTIYPGRFTLASAMEHIAMPDNVMGIVHDKSTWARVGLALQNTVIEPGWKGFLTLEITNHSRKRPWWKFWASRNGVDLVAGTPIAQIVFHLLDTTTEAPYAGKYQGQAAGPQPALFERSPPPPAGNFNKDWDHPRPTSEATWDKGTTPPAIEVKQTCPRRQEGGPWDPGFEGVDTWQIAPNGDRTCSFCGSLHPEDYVAIVKDYVADVPGVQFDTSNKGYKRYARRAGISNAGQGGIKFYGAHIPTDEAERAALHAADQAACIKFSRLMTEAYDNN